MAQQIGEPQRKTVHDYHRVLGCGAHEGAREIDRLLDHGPVRRSVCAVRRDSGRHLLVQRRAGSDDGNWTCDFPRQRFGVATLARADATENQRPHAVSPDCWTGGEGASGMYKEWTEPKSIAVCATLALASCWL